MAFGWGFCRFIFLFICLFFILFRISSFFFVVVVKLCSRDELNAVLLSAPLPTLSVFVHGKSRNRMLEIKWENMNSKFTKGPFSIHWEVNAELFLIPSTKPCSLYPCLERSVVPII